VKQINDVDDLNLFISSLKNEDVTKTVFLDLWARRSTERIVQSSHIKKETTIFQKTKFSQMIENNGNVSVSQKKAIDADITSNTIQNTPFSILATGDFRLPTLEAEKPQSKVNLICNKLQQAFQHLDPEKYLLCILTTYVTKNPPEVEEALKLVQQLRKKENQESESLTAEKALKYLIFLVDVNKLYDIALGMYDFELVMMVAQKSQKDPKEYIPFLSKRQNEEKYYRQYNIDKYLGRFEKALENLTQAGEQYFEECIDFIKQHKLYKKAAEIYSKNSSDNTNKHFLRVMDIWGEFLFKQQQYTEAALVWSSCQQEAKALEAYVQISDWQNAISVAYKLKKSEEEIVKLGETLAQSLASLHKYKESAFIMERYCHQIDQAIQLLVTGHFWDDAIRLCYTYDKTSTVENLIHPTVLQTFEFLKDGIEDSRVRYIELYNRLVEVRYEKLTKPKRESVENLDEETMSQVSTSETGSVLTDVSAPSQASTLSFRSYLSKANSKRTKGRKKQKQKKMSGRKGSPYEEEFLLQQINEIFPTAQFQLEVSATLRALIYFGHLDKARTLQNIFDKYLEIVEKSLDVLNTPSPTDTQQSNNTENEQATLESQSSATTKLKTNDEAMRLLINPVNLTRLAIEKVVWKLNIL
jgi:elongator complex protein 1